MRERCTDGWLIRMRGHGEISYSLHLNLSTGLCFVPCISTLLEVPVREIYQLQR